MNSGGKRPQVLFLGGCPINKNTSYNFLAECIFLFVTCDLIDEDLTLKLVKLVIYRIMRLSAVVPHAFVV